jgi:hypothetical protein
MKKKITLLSLLLLLASSGLSYAETTGITSNNPDSAPVRVAMSSDIILGAVKSGVYSLGTMLLNKYMSPTTYVPYTTVTPTTTTTTQDPNVTTQTTTTQDQTITTQTTPDQPEPMIPVS